MLSPFSHVLTRVLAALYALTGVVLFVAPDWASANFAWNVSPFVAMTIGGWCLGTAVYAWIAARRWRWSENYPCLIYLWTFGLLETLVLLLHLDRLRLDVVMAWPYLAALIVSVIAAVKGGLDWWQTRPVITSSGMAAPWWVRLMVISFFLIVFVLGIVVGGRAAPTNGGIFPEVLSLFTVRAFGAFYFSLAVSAVPMLRERSLSPIAYYMMAGLGLVVPITAAALVNIDKFDFAARPDGLIYVGAYLAAFVGALMIIGYARLRASGAGEIS